MLTIKEIMEIIPHRPPFLLVDRIDELVPGKHAIGKKCVSMNEPFFVGHFPGEPVMPGVLVMEALAQVGAVICLSLEQNKGKTVYLGGVSKARFRNKVVPGGGAYNMFRTARWGYGAGIRRRPGFRGWRDYFYDWLASCILKIRALI